VDFTTLQLVNGQRGERDLAPGLARLSDRLGRQQRLAENLSFESLVALHLRLQAARLSRIGLS
jgi:hypothetical protein